MSIQAGGVAQSDRLGASLPMPTLPIRTTIGLGCDEGQTEQVLDLRAVDLFGPTPLEVIELSTGKRAFLIRRSILRFSRIVASPSTNCSR